ncbi:MAG: response regulator [Spirochaetes bacterium]|nr:MAG: response regulator [Spirochaetota bacterium]
MNKLPGTFLAVLIALLSSLPAIGSTPSGPAVIDTAEKEYFIGRSLDILEDKTGELSFEEACSPTRSDLFISSEKDIPNYSFSKSAYWVRFRVTFPRKESPENMNWFIKCSWHGLTSVTAYMPEPGNRYRKSETGIIYAPDTRDVPDRFFLFKMREFPGETVTVYIRVMSLGAVLIPLSIISEKIHYREVHREYIFTGAFFGILIIMILYHLFLYAAVRNRDYLYFIYYILSLIIIQMLEDGSLVYYLPSGGARGDTIIMVFFSAAAMILGVLFFKHILNLKEDLPAAAKLVNLLILVFVLLAFSSFLLPMGLFWILFYIILLFTILVSAGISVIRIMQEYDIARYYVIILILSVIGKATSSLIRFDLVPLNWLTLHMHPIFSIATAVILSYAISLHIRVMEQERILAQERAIENLKKAERMKDEFLANTSHELKTPLHGIVGLSELMLRGGRTISIDRVFENLSLISANGRRLASLVNDILDFSSMKHGGLSLNLKSVNCHDSVSMVVSLLAPLVESKAVEIRNSIRKDFAHVRADDERFRQILTNLVGNSIKFTPYGVIEVSARLIQTGGRDTAEMAEIRVYDTGTGIRPEDKARIFNSFEQGEGSISRMLGGTGLGLAITKKLVELQGGTIRAESEPGKGSSFFFTLPVQDIEDHTESDEPIVAGENPVTLTGDTLPAGLESDSGTITSKPDGGRPSILITDDDPVSVKILHDFLSGLDYAVHTTPDGRAALEILKDVRIDLLLLDVMMPGLSGYDVLKKIRETRSPEELPVILITAKSQIDDIKRGFDAGANDYIIKPFMIEEISHRVENMLKLRNILIPDEPGLSINEKGSSRFIPYKDLIYLSSSGKKTVAHTTRNDVEILMLIKELERKLPGTFIRIHKQFIINTEFLEEVVHIRSGHYEAILNDADDTRLNVSRTHIGTLREFLKRKRGDVTL